ncbi:unnamed protein product, partial [Brassica rapa subsp. narinosa]
DLTIQGVTFLGYPGGVRVFLQTINRMIHVDLNNKSHKKNLQQKTRAKVCGCKIFRWEDNVKDLFKGCEADLTD